MAGDCDFDVLIVGGGLVGASLACALGQTSFKVAVVESFPLGSKSQPSYDDRTIALAYSSRRIFETIDVWQRLQPDDANPIQHIHISDRGHFGITRLHADDRNAEARGYVVETRALGAALYDKLQSLENVTLYCPSDVKSVYASDPCAKARLVTEGEEKECTARLVVVADGGRSALREQLEIETRKKVYDQVAIVANVTPGRPHGNTAYERFTGEGPLAVLPIGRQRCAVVWSTKPEQAEAMLQWTDEEFLSGLQQRFGNRLGQFQRAGRRQRYPLALTQVENPLRPRLVLIGNAAHTVHPVAGQGFNLGLRDIATLAQVLVEAQTAGIDIGVESTLQRYVDWRQRDNRRTRQFTDGLIGIFSNDFLPLVIGRNLGLLAVDLFPSIKRLFMRRTSGLTGHLPKLARGVSLRTVEK